MYSSHINFIFTPACYMLLVTDKVNMAQQLPHCNKSNSTQAIIS